MLGSLGSCLPGKRAKIVMMAMVLVFGIVSGWILQSVSRIVDKFGVCSESVAFRVVDR